MQNSSESLKSKYKPARIYFAPISNRKEQLSSSAGTASISEGEQAILLIVCIIIFFIFRALAIVLIPAFLFWYFCYAPTSAKHNDSNFSNSVSSLCERHGWEMVSSHEILLMDKKGYIGRGEQEVCQSLAYCGLSVHHQVRIQPSYTADILCVDPISCKACIVEIDGSQHWENLKNIELDNSRMRDMAQIGVSTIRFRNDFSQKNPHMCRDEIIKLLK